MLFKAIMTCSKVANVIAPEQATLDNLGVVPFQKARIPSSFRTEEKQFSVDEYFFASSPCILVLT